LLRVREVDLRGEDFFFRVVLRAMEDKVYLVYAAIIGFPIIAQMVWIRLWAARAAR
jgi:hypothetical protein